MDSYMSSKLLKDLARISQQECTSTSQDSQNTGILDQNLKLHVDGSKQKEETNCEEDVKPDIQGLLKSFSFNTSQLNSQLADHKRPHAGDNSDVQNSKFKGNSSVTFHQGVNEYHNSCNNLPNSKTYKEKQFSTKNCKGIKKGGKANSGIAPLNKESLVQSSIDKEQQIMVGVGRPKNKAVDMTFWSPTKEISKPEISKHKCDVCEKQFYQISNFNRHKRMHADEKENACRICRKQFKSLCNLKIHRRLQLCVKAHACNICGKDFSLLYHLRIHKRKHTGEMLHECERCRKCFFQDSVLKLHTNLHLNHWPHRCLVCGKGFIQKSQLKHHSREHRESASINIQENDANGNQYGNSNIKENALAIVSSENNSVKKQVLTKRGKYKKRITLDEKGRMFFSRISVATGHPFEGELNSMDFTELSKFPSKSNSIPSLCKKSIPKMYLTYYADKSQTAKVKKDPEEKSWQCNVCGKAFKLKSNLVRHTKYHHSEERTYKCDFCDARFKGATDLKVHQRLHTGEKPYSCPYCDKTFRSGSNQKNHIRVHTGERPYKCEVCNATFSLPTSLQEHKRLHTGEKPFKCDECGKDFARRSGLRSHRRIHVAVADREVFPCDICGKQFTYMASLTQHKIRHEGEKQYKCDICNKPFISQAEVKLHKTIHTGERPYQCKVCLKTYRLRSNLQEHERSHSDETTFKCHLCDRAFKYRTSLKYHLKVHSGELSHLCEICGQAFRDSGILRQHKRIHKQEKVKSENCDE